MGTRLTPGAPLFKGGPGRTAAPPELVQEIESIVSRLYVLPDDVMVWPGHGDATTLRDSKREYAVFAGKQHPADLCGDVVWTES
jgi:glyoxylase-like metal-dependent hydrolase (beta-lactamase superfamily II)